MAITMKSHNMRFDAETFALALCDLSYREKIALAKEIGISPSTVNNWIHGGFEGDYKHPSMQNFLACCNALDLDPREYFCFV